MNSYDLSRKFVDFSFENPSKIKPNHYALFFFAIEHCNRLGWKKEFGLPTTMTMEAIGIRSYNTYSKTFKDLVDFGFFTLIERSTNQYSANIIALSFFNKAQDKAFIKHATKQSESTQQSICSIDKPIYKETINNIYSENDFLENWGKCRKHFLKKPTHIKKLSIDESYNLNKALKNFTKEEINKSMLGLFKQQNKNISSMYLKPRHFLENIDKYLSAELSKDYTLYGKSEKVQQGSL